MARNKTAEPKTEAAKTAATIAPAAKEEVKTAVKTEAAPAKAVTVKDDAKTAVKAAPADKKPAAKKTAAAKKPAAKKTTEKPAAKKAAAKTTASAKAAKPEAKTTAKATKPAKAEPAKKGGRKPKELTAEDICAKIAKKAGKAKAAKIDGTIAVEFKVYGWENNDENHKFIYIEVKDGKLTVAPYQYDDCTLKADIPLADIVAFADGKLSLKDAKIYAAGNFGDALKLASLFE